MPRMRQRLRADLCACEAVSRYTPWSHHRQKPLPSPHTPPNDKWGGSPGEGGEGVAQQRGWVGGGINTEEECGDWVEAAVQPQKGKDTDIHSHKSWCKCGGWREWERTDKHHQNSWTREEKVPRSSQRIQAAGALGVGEKKKTLCSSFVCHFKYFVAKQSRTSLTSHKNTVQSRCGLLFYVHSNIRKSIKHETIKCSNVYNTDDSNEK